MLDTLNRSRPIRTPFSSNEANAASTKNAEIFNRIERSISDLLDRGFNPVSLGGDHSITYPIVKAFARKFGKLSILHFDAHPDLYDEFEGNRYSHACPFARIMEEELVQRLIQVGVRTMTGHQRELLNLLGLGDARRNMVRISPAE